MKMEINKVITNRDFGLHLLLRLQLCEACMSSGRMIVTVSSPSR